MNPTSSRAAELATDRVEREPLAPHGRRRPIGGASALPSPSTSCRRSTHLESTPFMYAENTRALPSALPAARRTELGCQSSERTVVLRGFLMCLATHQLLSSSNWQTAIVLAPLATANFSSLGDQRTNVADRLRRRRTSVGCHVGAPVSGSGRRFQT